MYRLSPEEMGAVAKGGGGIGVGAVSITTTEKQLNVRHPVAKNMIVGASPERTKFEGDQNRIDGTSLLASPRKQDRWKPPVSYLQQLDQQRAAQQAAAGPPANTKPPFFHQNPRPLDGRLVVGHPDGALQGATSPSHRRKHKKKWLSKKEKEKLAAAKKKKKGGSSSDEGEVSDEPPSPTAEEEQPEPPHLTKPPPASGAHLVQYDPGNAVAYHYTTLYQQQIEETRERLYDKNRSSPDPAVYAMPSPRTLATYSRLPAIEHPSAPSYSSNVVSHNGNHARKSPGEAENATAFHQRLLHEISSGTANADQRHDYVAAVTDDIQRRMTAKARHLAEGGGLPRSKKEFSPFDRAPTTSALVSSIDHFLRGQLIEIENRFPVDQSRQPHIPRTMLLPAEIAAKRTGDSRPTMEEYRRRLRLAVYQNAVRIFCSNFKAFQPFLAEVMDEHDSYAQFLDEDLTMHKEVILGMRHEVHQLRQEKDAMEEEKNAEIAALKKQLNKELKRTEYQRNQDKSRKTKESTSHVVVYNLERDVKILEDQVAHLKKELEKQRRENENLIVTTFSDNLETAKNQIDDLKEQLTKQEEELNQAHDDVGMLQLDLGNMAEGFERHAQLELQPEMVRLSEMGLRVLFPGLVPEEKKKKGRQPVKTIPSMRRQRLASINN